MIDVKLFINQKTQGNTYVIMRGKDCFIIDPGGEDMSVVVDYIIKNELDLKGILLTHGHYDHIIGIPEIIKIKDVPVYISEQDELFLYDSTLSLSILEDIDFTLNKGVKIIKIKENDNIFGFKVLETPGHTHGSVCYYDEDAKIMFSGDTIFKMTYGRTDFPTGSIKNIKQSLKKILSLDEDIEIYPGHGGTTYIKNEREHYIF